VSLVFWLISDSFSPAMAGARRPVDRRSAALLPDGSTFVGGATDLGARRLGRQHPRSAPPARPACATTSSQLRQEYLGRRTTGTIAVGRENDLFAGSEVGGKRQMTAVLRSGADGVSVGVSSGSNP